MTGLEAGTRVLYVDDERRARDRVTTFLEREHGADVATAARAEVAARLITEESVDCVVSEYERPGTGEASFLDQIRDRDPDLPVVLFTRADDPAIADRTAADDATAFVYKGDDRIRTTALARGIDELLADQADASVERIQRERKLQSSDARLKALSRAFPDYAFLYDEDGTYLDVLLGWELDGGRLNTVEELIGESVEDVLPADSAETLLDAIREALANDTLVKTTYRMDTPADPLWYEAYAAPLPDEIDDRDTVVVAARDVTARHRSQQELERQNERLEQFASLVSHDLRNPLSVAGGYTQTAMDASDDDQVAGFLEEVQHSHERMEELINDVLTLARQGKTVTETEPVDLADVANDAWETVETGNATLAVEADGQIAADRSRIRQVFENVYRNCIEHGSTGDQTATPSDDPDGNVAVRVGSLGDAPGFFVEDDGPGIPEDRREDVFDDGYTTTVEGTGLGLSIVRSIVEAHGWTVEATESESGGARFEVRGVSPAE